MEEYRKRKERELDSSVFVEALQVLSTYEHEASGTPESKRSKSAPSASVPSAAVAEAVESLSLYSKETGLNEDQLLEVAQLALQPKLGERLSNKLIRCLIPQKTVGEECVVQLLGAFSGLSHPLQVTILKWLILVYDLIDEKEFLHRLYGVFFHFIEYDSLRPYLCHILYRLTRREDVLPFRIRKLYSIQERIGQDTPLLSLLVLYKQYYNDMVCVTQVKSRVSHIFKNPDPKLHKIILRVQEKYNSDYIPQDKPFGFLHQHYTIQENPFAPKKLKRGTKKVIPELTTSVSVFEEKEQLTLEQISSIDEFAHNATLICLPNQLVSILENRFLQHFISLQPDKESVLRISHWLKFVLEEEFQWRDQSKDMKRRSNLLKALSEFTSFTQETLPIFDEFVCEMIKTWNGDAYQSYVLSLISRTTPCSFNELYAKILKPLEKVFFSGSARTKAKIISCYSELLYNWVKIDWKKLHSVAASDHSASLKSEIPKEGDHWRAIFEFIKYVDRISCIALRIENDHSLVQHHILHFFELVSQLTTKYDLPFVSPPSVPLVERLFLSPTAMAISRICGILANYKAEFEHLKESGGTKIQLTFSNGMKKISLLNVYIWTLCSSLWRNKLLIEESGEVKDFFEMSPNYVAALKKESPDLGAALSIVNSSAFLSFAWKYLDTLREQVPSAFTVNPTPYMIKDQVKIHFVDYLNEMSMKGLHEFLYTFIGTLVSRKKQQENKHE